jgi:hypothetical protein
MKLTKNQTLFVGLGAGVAYAFFTMLLVTRFHQNVSIGYIFVLPFILGMIPVMLSTQEQLKSYWNYIILPWGITIVFCLLCIALHFEGVICLVIIVGPFLILGTLGAFIYRLIKLRDQGPKTALYSSLFLPFLFLAFEHNFRTTDQFHIVTTQIEINSNKAVIWENIKNVKDIQKSEISNHFVHLIGIPKPLSGELDKDGIGGIRSITWEKGIKFQEIIKTWDNENSFTYDINVDSKSIPPTTLDEHVMIGGRYFDVIEGGYKIDQISDSKNLLTLTCKYRVTTNLNFYSKLWADFILDDFNEMILEVIKKRSEK